MRRAKIVCTMGPAVNTPERIRALVDAGMDVARLNMSHGSYDDHEAIYRMVRAASDESGHAIGIFADLQGPKIRLETFADGPAGSSAASSSPSPPATCRATARSAGRRTRGCPATWPRATRSSSTTARCAQGRVGRRHRRGHRGRRRGQGQQQQGHQPPGRRGLRAGAVGEGHRRPALGAADRRRLRGPQLRAARGRRRGRARDHAGGGRERPHHREDREAQALENIDAIIDAFDGIMVARGDLGVECPLEDVPVHQKLLVDKARANAKPAIVPPRCSSR